MMNNNSFSQPIKKDINIGEQDSKDKIFEKLQEYSYS